MTIVGLESIYSSGDLLREGLIWRVGNGATIRIWKNQWLPSHSTYRINSLPVVLDPEATVSELLEGDPKWWNYQLLSSMFDQDVVKLITSIPPSSTNHNDTLIWRGTNNGLFSVRSAYYI